MIKKTNKIITIVIIAISFLFIGNVNAANKNGTAYWTGYTTTNVQYKNESGQMVPYNNSTFKVRVDGSDITFLGHCIDANYAAGPKYDNNLSSLQAGFAVSCTSVGSNYAMNYLLKHLTNNPMVDTLAMRMVTLRTGVSKAPQKAGVAIKKYIDGDHSYLQGKNQEGTDQIAKAYNLYTAAMNYHNSHKNSNTNRPPLASNGTGKLTYTKVAIDASASKYTATFSVTSKEHLNNVVFSCAENCRIESQNWNGTSGEVKISINPIGACSYKINATYNYSGGTPGGGTPGDNDALRNMYVCDGGASYQQIVIETNGVVPGGIIPGVNIPDTSNPDETYTGNATDPGTGDGIENNNNYYKTWCDSGTPNHCSAQTEVNIPTYCDNADGKEISITAPTDTDSCIIKAKDEAGNSYQDQVVSNDYCSVYCKEDYNISLPGAQYANSGKYFKMKNTVVKATRTCYVASAKNEKNTNGINTTKFISDVKELQKKVVDEYNKYIEAKEISAVVNDSSKMESKTSTNAASGWHCTVKDPKNPNNCLKGENTCSATEDKTYSQAKSDLTITIYKVDSITFNADGSIASMPTITKTIKKEDMWTGTKYTSTNSGSTCASTTDSKTASKYSASSEDLTSAVNALKAALANISQCYSWDNNMCLDPIVNFKYSEPYNVKFDKVKENTGTTIENYSSDKTIYQSKQTVSFGKDQLKEYKYLSCGTNGCQTEGSKTGNINLAYQFISKSKEMSVEYNNKTEFATNYPHGTVTEANKDKLQHNYEYLGAVFPLAMKTEKGIYNWTLSFKNLGQYNNGSCKLGRLNAVADKLGKTTDAEVGYACIYVADCPDCDYGCQCPENLPNGYECIKRGKWQCDIIPPDDKKCPDCDVDCVNCIFDGNSMVNYRTISVNELNPNNREIGNNWGTEKGKTTEKAIEQNGENIYKKPEYSYTITPTQMKEIRDYNKKKGTYVADDLSYEAQGGFSNARGISSFLTNGKNKMFTENARNNKWTLWNGAIDENGTGPSWK